MATDLARFRHGDTAYGAEVGGGSSGNDKKVADAIAAIPNRAKRQRWDAGVATDEYLRRAASVTLGAYTYGVALLVKAPAGGMWLKGIGFHQMFVDSAMEDVAFEAYKSSVLGDPFSGAGTTSPRVRVATPLVVEAESSDQTYERVQMQVTVPWVEPNHYLIVRFAAGAGGLTAGRLAMTPVVRYMTLHVA